MLHQLFLRQQSSSKICKIVRSACRRISSNTEPATERDLKWKAIYHYRRIQACRLIARAKFVQTVASLGYLPYSYYQYCIGNIDVSWFSSTASIAIAAPIILAVFSRYLNRLVGVVSISDDSQWIRFGYLTFWGQRKNVIIRIDDLLPLSETGNIEGQKMVKIRWYSDSKRYLFLPTIDCDILDNEKAVLVFGNASFIRPRIT